jgi:hypothetical protein
MLLDGLEDRAVGLAAKQRLRLRGGLDARSRQL